jgi:membrane-associated phospholipid phosphatase
VLCSSTVPLYAQETPLIAQESTVIPAPPQSKTHQFAKLASDSLLPVLGAGELVLLSDNRDGRELAMRGAGSVLTTYAATAALKSLVRAKRPNRESRDSFPSGHASLSFAMAATLGSYKPSYALPAYAAATTIAWSRVKLGEHRWREVIAGAALGFVIGRAWSRHDVERKRSSPALAFGFGF